MERTALLEESPDAAGPAAAERGPSWEQGPERNDSTASDTNTISCTQTKTCWMQITYLREPQAEPLNISFSGSLNCSRKGSFQYLERLEEKLKISYIACILEHFLDDIYRQLKPTVGEVQFNRGSQHRFVKGKSRQTNDYF